MRTVVFSRKKQTANTYLGYGLETRNPAYFVEIKLEDGEGLEEAYRTLYDHDREKYTEYNIVRGANGATLSEALNARNKVLREEEVKAERWKALERRNALLISQWEAQKPQVDKGKVQELANLFKQDESPVEEPEPQAEPEEEAKPRRRDKQYARGPLTDDFTYRPDLPHNYVTGVGDCFDWVQDRETREALNYAFDSGDEDWHDMLECVETLGWNNNCSPKAKANRARKRALAHEEIAA